MLACGHSELTELFGSHVSLPRRGKTLDCSGIFRIITLAEKSGAIIPVSTSPAPAVAMRALSRYS